MPSAQLVPLGLGELLDRTFSYFRKHFWLFAGIMVLPEGLLVALNIIIQISLSAVPVPQQTPTPQAAAQSAAYAMRAGLGFVGIMIPYYVAYALALGAATYALSEVYLGRDTTIRESYRAVRRKFGRLLNVIFSILIRTWGAFLLVILLFAVVIGSMAQMPKVMAWVIGLVVLAAIPALIAVGILTIIFLLRYGAAVPALLLEKLSARQALKRSVALTKGYLWRLLVVFLLMMLIRGVLVSLCQAPFTITAILVTVKGARPGLWLTIPSLLVGGEAAAASAPLLMISFAIAYYDLRVRKEGFDLQLMMANLDESEAPGAPSQASAKEPAHLEDASVLGIFLLTFLTGGIYQPIWFMTRRRAINSLRSPEKLQLAALSVALVALIGNFCLPFVGSFKWGSLVEAENALGPLHPFILLVAGIIMVVQCFKVRRILLDHLAPQQEGMFSASIRFQYDDLLSRLGTFFLGIFYLQHKINGLLDWLKSDEDGHGEKAPTVLPVSSLSQMNS